jgi:hypothetical protein
MRFDLPIKVFSCTIFVHVPSKDLNLTLEMKNMLASDMHPTKKDTNLTIFKPWKIHVSMDVSSIKNQPYFIKTHLQVIQIMSFKFILEELI